MELVAGVHPPPGHVEPLAVVGTALDRGVVEVRGPVDRRMLGAVVVRAEEAEDERDEARGAVVADGPCPRRDASGADAVQAGRPDA
jgi:hypothetical protein